MDHIVKLNEVPKGQKMQYIWDYWRVPGLIIIIGTLVLGSLLWTIFFPKKVHMEVLFTCKYGVNNEQIEQVKSDLKEAFKDGNEHNYKVTYVQNNIEVLEANPQAYAADISKLIAEITSATAYVYILDDDMFCAFKEDGLIATYKELGIDSGEDIKISADKIFKNESFKGKFYLSLRPKEFAQLDNEKDIEKYEYSVNYLKSLIE